MNLNTIKILMVVAFFVFTGCADKTERPDNAIDTGRQFIRASLDGKFKEAEVLILKDSQNIQLFDSYKRFYNRLSDAEKTNYRKASYEINNLTEQGDTATLINYSNSYMKKPMEIKVVKQSSGWFIDFKFTYSDQPEILK